MHFSRRGATTLGLTLLEVLVAVSIAVALASASLFGYAAALSRWRLNAATRQLVMDVKLARLRAIADATDKRLRFTAGARAYQLQQRRGNGSYVDEGPPVLLPAGVHVVACSGAGSSVGFRPRGYAGAFGTITVANTDGEQRRVVVDIVGRARVE